MRKKLHFKLSRILLLLTLISGVNMWGQVNIIPTRTDVSGFNTWTDSNVTGSTYLQLLTATSSTITPAMNFNSYTAETLNFKARTFGGSTAAEIIITVSISIDNGSNWTVLGTRTPVDNNLQAQTPFPLNTYNGTQVKIRFSVAGTSNTVGVGIDDIAITGMAAATPVVTAASPTGTVGVPLSYQIVATNSPTSYAVSAGTLPAGLSLNTSTGVISGTPTTVGSSNVTVTATNSNGTSAGAVLSFTISGVSPTLTAAAGATVDNAFAVTFTDDAAWRAAITSITVGVSTLPASAYNTTSAGQIVFTPSASTLLQSSGSKSITVIATGYSNATVTQSIGAGVPSKLIMGTQPAAPTVNGGALGTQPTVTIRDQYNNTTTATAAVTATVGAGAWTIGGGLNPVNAVSGTATYSGLTATSTASVTGATITFTSPGLTSATSNVFNIPGPPPANDLCTSPAVITVNAAVTAGTLDGATFTAISNADDDDHSDVWYSFTPTCSGLHTITLNNFTGDMDLYLFDQSCPTDILDAVDYSTATGAVAEDVAVTLLEGTTYTIRVVAYEDPLTTFNLQVTSAASAPVVMTSAVSDITMTSAELDVTVLAGCGSATGARGVVYSTTANPVLGAPSAGVGSGDGTFTAQLSGLTDDTTYYVRAYATNSAGTTYSNQVTFVTNSINAPLALQETTLTAGGTGFTANWQAVDGAMEYRLDISTSSNFGTGGPANVTENFETGMPDSYTSANRSLSTGIWTFVNVIRSTNPTNNYSSSTSGAQLQGNTSSSLTTPAFSGVSSISFYAKRGSNATTLVVKKIVNGVTTQVGDPIAVNATMTQHTVSINEPSSDVQIVIQSNGNQTLYVDAVTINYTTMVPSYIVNYNNRLVAGTSQAVTGLTAGNTYYYRVRAVGTNSTSANSNVIGATAATAHQWNGTTWIPSAPSLTDVAIIAGDYNTFGLEGVFEAASVIINSGVLTVASGTTLEIEGAIVNNAAAANFIVENGGYVIQNADVDNTGAATVYNDSNELFRGDYTTWSSPVTGQNIVGFSPFTQANRFYTYGVMGSQVFNSVLAEDNYAANNGSSTFTPGRGYHIRMPNKLKPGMDGYPENVDSYFAGTTPVVFHGQFIGTPNNGTINIAYGTSGGFNAVGNPYPSPINVAAFFADNSNNLADNFGIFFWRKKNNAEATSYAVLTEDGYAANDGGFESEESQYDFGGQQWENYFDTTPDADWTIAPGQGFFVKAAAGAQGLSFNNEMRQNPIGGQPFFRNGNSEPVEKSKLSLNLSAAGQGFSQTTLVYNPTSTLGVDYGRDAKSFSDSGFTAIYTFTGEEALIIQSRPAFEATDVVPLGYKVNTAGEYTITLRRQSGVFEGTQKVYIKDLVTGVTHNIKDGAYTFTSEAGTFNDRFEIVYSVTELGTANPVADTTAVVVYKQDNVLKVNTGANDMQTITVYDIRGRVIFSQKDINAAQTVLTGLAAQQQVLLVEVIMPNGKVTKKVVY